MSGNGIELLQQRKELLPDGNFNAVKLFFERYFCTEEFYET